MIHRGSKGEIGCPQGDFVEMGDSLAYTSHEVYLSDSDFDLSFFEVGFGGYVRHPDPKQTNNGFGAYYKGPNRGVISRDQLCVLIAALIKRKAYKASMRLLIHSFCGVFLFSYNTIKNGVDPREASWKMPDITFMDIWAMYIRMLGPFTWIFWPLLNVLDIWMLLATIVYNNKSSSDPISFAIKSFVQREHYPTITSFIAWKILNKHKLMCEIGNYWRGWRKSSGMTNYYRKKIEALK